MYQCPTELMVKITAVFRKIVTELLFFESMGEISDYKHYLVIFNSFLFGGEIQDIIFSLIKNFSFFF